jgi:hypothetical protein
VDHFHAVPRRERDEQIERVGVSHGFLSREKTEPEA